MKRPYFAVWILSLNLLFSQVPSFSQALWASPLERTDPRSMTFPPPSFQPPRAERLILPNGMVLYFMEDHELPLIGLEAMIRTGSIYEPADQIGLAGLTGAVMRTGGTRHHRGNEIDEMLDQMAARLSVGIGTDSGGASLDILKKDFDAGLALFTEILMHPTFEEEKLEIAKNTALEMIRRRNDHPSSIASREFGKQIYGDENPYGRESTEATIQSVGQGDLIAFHKKYFAPNNMIMGVTGDFNKQEMVEKIKRAFAGWEKKKIDFPKVAPVVERKEGGVYQILRPISQTHVRIGHLGIRQDNPDFFALSVMDDILGGNSFISRLFRDVRTQRGLAYSVGSVFRPGNFERGIFVAYGQTRADATYQAISTILDHIRRIRQEPVSDEELRLAKESFLNSFIFSFSNSAQIVSRQMSLEYYDLPSDFLERYRDNVAKVTKEDILKVAKKHLHPDQLVILAVGDEAAFDRPLSALGEVIQIVVPPP